MKYDEIEECLDSPRKLAALRLTLLGDFELYLLFIFLANNHTNAIIKPFHKDIIFSLESLVFQTNEKRNLCINIPVGSGKSLIVQYFITWCFARNVSNCFLYTSHSERLINKLSKEAKEIVEEPTWVKVFGGELKKDERSKVNWGFKDSKKRTGLTAAPIGGALTGVDAGNPNVDGFSGALIIDDPLDVGKARHPLARRDCIAFYTDKLATRRRTPTTPTILLMQRMEKNDLTGYLKNTEPELWRFITVPAIDENGDSFWPERFPVDEMAKISETNSFLYNSQYQQKPQISGGTVIKSRWFTYYQGVKDVKFRRLFMTADTAQKTKEAHDFSVICAWGISISHLYLLDMVRDKWETPALKTNVINFWNKWKIGVSGKLFNGIYIEDKSSGTGLIQSLKIQTRIPIIPIQRNTDKYLRVTDILTTLKAEKVMLPRHKDYSFNIPLLNECEEFSRDMNHEHDDIVDNLVDACNIFTRGYTAEDLL